MLLLTSTFVLILTNILTYIMLLSKNAEWKSEVIEKDNIKYRLADAIAGHVYYDGDSIPCNQKVEHYSRSGRCIGSEYLRDVLQDDKVVMLLSPNCCSVCAKDEIEKLQELSPKIGRRNVIVIADYAMHKHPQWSMSLDKKGFYEIDTDHLGLKGSPTRETPVVMLTQNGRIKTSFIVGPQTSEFADRFHEYLVEYFKGNK